MYDCKHWVGLVQGWQCPCEICEKKFKKERHINKEGIHPWLVWLYFLYALCC